MNSVALKKLLKEVAPYLAATKAPPLEPPPHIVARLKKSLADAFPEVQSLSPQDMKLVILKLFTQQTQWDGGQITSFLRKARLVLKDAGEGAIYPLLHDLADEGLLESEAASAETRYRAYRITDKGRAQLIPHEAASAGLSIGLGRIAQCTE